MEIGKCYAKAVTHQNEAHIVFGNDGISVNVSMIRPNELELEAFDDDSYFSVKLIIVCELCVFLFRFYDLPIFCVPLHLDDIARVKLLPSLKSKSKDYPATIYLFTAGTGKLLKTKKVTFDNAMYRVLLTYAKVAEKENISQELYERRVALMKKRYTAKKLWENACCFSWNKEIKDEKYRRFHELYS